MELLKRMTGCVRSVAHVVSRCLSSVLSLCLLRFKCDDEADDTRRRQRQLDEPTSRRSAGPRVKPFDEIPGPLHFPVIGSQWLYYWPGPYTLDKLHLANEDKLWRYGPIVKEHYLWNFPIVHLYDKQDIEEVLKYPSKYPIRPGLEAQCAYRLSRPDRYKSVGLVNAQGQEWLDLRTKLISQLTSPSLGSYIVEQANGISDELITKLHEEVHSHTTVEHFEKHVYKFGLEVMFAILLGERLGALKNPPPPVAERLMTATDKLFEVSHDTMYGLPWWKCFPTKSFKSLTECEDTVYEVFADLVQQAAENPSCNDSPVLNHILNVPNVDHRDKIVMLIDLVAAGIETTGNAILFLLNNVLSNPEIASRVRQELDEILSAGRPWTVQLLGELKYLRACISESLRLTPVTPNVARILEKSFVFQGYHVPAGTLVVCETWVASQLDENYADAKAFKPERWLSQGSNTCPFLAVPFGAGKRQCPGKRIAEYEMLTLTAKLLWNFDITFLTQVEQVYKFLIVPKGPIHVALQARLPTCPKNY